MENASFLLEDILWPEPLPDVRQSAFSRYSRPRDSEISPVINSHQNMNKRMLGFLRAIHTMKKTSIDAERDRCYRHTINERFRRDKQREHYAALHSILPPRTKIDKNSIVKMATLRIEELKSTKDELQKRKYELEKKLTEDEDGFKMRFRVARTISPIDSTISVLRCMKRMDLKPRAIHTEFSPNEFRAIFTFQSKVEAVQVEKAVASALTEAEKNRQ